MPKVFDRLRRLLRQDPVPELGVSTVTLLERRIDEGKLDEAKALARYAEIERQPLHDLFADWIWHMLTRIGANYGEAEVGKVLRETQSGWMMRRVWKSFQKMTVLERVHMTAEMMRSHAFDHMSGKQTVTVVEEEDRYSVVMDPCGSGGRMRRGDPQSRLEPPYDFGVSQEPHDWSWGEKGVPYYCAHCALNEILPMEWGGYPLWVTGYDADASKPCAWHFYKTADAIPEHYFTRVGRRKPSEGTY